MTKKASNKKKPIQCVDTSVMQRFEIALSKTGELSLATIINSQLNKDMQRNNHTIKLSDHSCMKPQVNTSINPSNILNRERVKPKNFTAFTQTQEKTKITRSNNTAKRLNIAKRKLEQAVIEANKTAA